MARKIARTAGARPQVHAVASLPEWFTKNRVHAHTRLTLSRWEGTQDEFIHAADGLAPLGAHAFTRHAKTGDEDPIWPSGGPPVPNVVQDFVNSAHAAGLRIFTYYWHMSEKSLEAPHPDWVCKNHRGSPIRAARRGYYLDMSGPYGDLVLTRLRELAAMGVDGLFFDFRHLPPRGCWETALAQEWQALTGAPPPDPNDSNQVYRDFLDFKARRIEETFIHWRDQVRADYPNVLFIVSTTTIPGLTDREMTTRLPRLADSAKNEYMHAFRPGFNKYVFDDGTVRPVENHVRQALGWTVLRDASEGRPPHIWAAGTPNKDHAQAFAASLITFGCIANMDVHENALKEDGGEIPQGKTPLDGLQAAFALGNTVSPHMQGTEPVRWAAIHFSERIRNDRGGDFVAAWREVLWPLVGAYKELTRAGVPVGIVNDQQLEENALGGYRLLVLPNPNELSAAQQQAVARFRRRGAVIENDPAWPWSDPAAGTTADAAFRSAIRPHLRSASVRVVGGPPGRYGVSYRRPGRLVTAVTNDFSWVQIQWTASNVHPAPRPVAGMRVTWNKGHGLPETPRRYGRLRAIEAISGKTLTIEESTTGYTVRLPRFHFMALLVVTRELGPRAR